MRTIDGVTTNESQSTKTYPVQLIKFEVTNNNADSLFLNTGYQSITYDGDTYLPGSNIISLSPVEETKDVKTNAITIKLNGIPNTIIAALENVNAIGGKVTIYQLFWNDDTGAIQGQVYQKWQGIINSHAVDEENTNSGDVNITVECKNIVGAILNTRSGRFTSDTSFKKFTANDASMEFVASMVDFNPRFGAEE
tara:strand:- start:335 stop:919 length:585 start_codon:yes stop_codon:yes gene_type:complete